MKIIPRGADGVRLEVDKDVDFNGHDHGRDPTAYLETSKKDFSAATGVDVNGDDFTAFAHVPFHDGGGVLRWADAPLKADAAQGAPSDFFVARADLKWADLDALKHEGASFFLEPKRAGGEEIQLQGLGENTRLTNLSQG